MDNVIYLKIVYKMSHLAEKRMFVCRQSPGRGHYPPLYQPPERVCLLNICDKFDLLFLRAFWRS